MLQLSVSSSARIYLNQHKAKQHAGLLHACDQCEYKAKHKRDLKIHIESAYEGVVYSCIKRETTKEFYFHVVYVIIRQDRMAKLRVTKK